MAEFPALVKSLTDEDWRKRSAAAWSLGEIGPAARGATSILMKALADKNAVVSVAANYALFRTISYPKAIPSLIDALKASNESARREAARAFRRLGPAAHLAAPALANALNDGNPSVRSESALALGVVSGGAEPAVVALGSALGDEDCRVRMAAAEALAKIGPGAKDACLPLARALADGHKGVRTNSAYALARIGPVAEGVVPALVKSLSDENKWVRSCAAYALGRIGPGAEAAVPALAVGLRDSDYLARTAAANALARIGREAKAAVPSLIAAIGEIQNSCGVSRYDLLTVDSDEGSVVPLFFEEVTRDATSVRTASIRALREVGPEAGPAIPVLIRGLTEGYRQRECGEALRGIGLPAAPALIELLTRGNARARDWACTVLVNIGPGSVPRLTEALRSEDWRSRFNASYVLGYLGSDADAAVPDLVRCLRDQDRVVLTGVY